MFLNKTICEDLKDVVLEPNAKATYEILLSLKPDSSAKKVEILKEIAPIDSSDIKNYVIAMQHLQNKFRDIDSRGIHYESKPAAHMTRLLETLSDDQIDKVQFFRKKVDQ